MDGKFDSAILLKDCCEELSRFYAQMMLDVINNKKNEKISDDQFSQICLGVIGLFTAQSCLSFVDSSNGRITDKQMEDFMLSIIKKGMKDFRIPKKDIQ